jgi:hypothetical protein
MVTVDAGATITGSAPAAVTITMDGPPSYAKTALVVDGLVDGAGNIGVNLLPNAGSYWSSSRVEISSTGRIAGTTGIVVGSGTAAQDVYVIIDNSGAISSDSGPALVSLPSNIGGFYQIFNRATGKIDGLLGAFGTVINAGLIDGHAASAMDAGGNYISFGTKSVNNSGTISNAGAVETIRLGRGNVLVENSGLISNSGLGAALTGESVSLINGTGGIVSTLGSTAIDAGLIYVINRGLIAGSVVASGNGYNGSTIDSTQGGTIRGDVVLGGANDTIVATFQDGLIQTGITGAIDAGAGTDRLQLEVAADQSFDAGFTLPATIEELAFHITDGASITLEEAFHFGSTIHTTDGSYGALINKANLNTVGAAIISDIFSGVLIDNRGQITANLNSTEAAAIVVNSYGRFANSGTIDGRGGAGVSLGYGTFSNSGTITADGTALILSQTTGENSGTIRSRNGIGLTAVGNVGIVVRNSGVIEGVTTGVLSSVIIDNSGTILGGDTAIALSPYGGLINRAGGIVRGGRNGIAPGDFGYSFNALVYNAGTIEGDVNLGNFFNSYGSHNVVVADSGSVINGDLHLGSGGDLFVTDLLNTGPGEFAGVTGTVSGGGQEEIRYRVGQNAAATYAPTGIFSIVGYDIQNNARLDLAMSPASQGTLWLAGSGTVALQGDLSVQSASIIGTRAPIVAPGVDYVPNSLSIINGGHLSFGLNTPYLPVAAAISLWTGDSLTNDGVISVNIGSVSGSFSAVSGGTIINNGIIELDGGQAISDPVKVTNNGVIRQIAGGTAASGIGGFSLSQVINTGEITLDGAAIAFGYGARDPSLVNSGSISSMFSNTVAYSGTDMLQLKNLAGGSISAGNGRAAISAQVAGITNAGVINGDVLLGVPYAYSGSAYVANGGTLNGNLTFGAGNDVFVSVDGSIGVSGTIDAGAGVDVFVKSYSADRTVDLATLDAIPSSFERRGIGASGANTIVTLTSSLNQISTPVTLIGDGTIVNTANITTAAGSRPSYLVTLGNAADPLNLSGAGSTLAFVNRGTIGDGVVGYVRSFANEGVVRNRFVGNIGVSLLASDASGFTFDNSGTISSPDNSPYYNAASAVTINGGSTDLLITQARLDNSGTILGGMAVGLNARAFSFTNSGTVSRGNGESASAYFSIGTGYSPVEDINAASATFDNSGTLSAGISVSVAAQATTFTNSGIIGAPSYGGAITLQQYGHQTGDATQGVYGVLDQDSLTFANSGSVQGNTNIYAQARTLTLSNSGTIDAAANLLADTDGSTFDIEASSQGSQVINLANSGTIASSRIGVSAVAIESYARSVDQQLNGYDETAGPLAGEPTITVAITNSGVLKADGGAYHLDAGASPYPWYPYDVPETLQLVAALGVSASSGGQSSITVTNEAGGVISATGATRDLNDPEGAPVAGFENIGSIAFLAAANSVSLVNAGTISGLDGGYVPADILVYNDISGDDFAGRFLAGAIQTLNSTDSITNLATGVINGSVDLGAMDDSMVNLGTINGNVFLGEGNDKFTHNLGATLNGVVDGGAGTDALIIDINGGGLLNQARFDPFVNFESQTISGTGTITTDGPLAVDSLFLRDANLTLAAGQTLQTASDIAVVFAGGTNSLVNMGTIVGGLSFAGGQNSFVNLGNIAGPVTLGEGNDVFTIGADSSVSGPVNGGAGNDLLILATGGSDASPVELRLSSFTGFDQTRQDGGTIALSGDYTTGQLNIANGRFIGRIGSILNAPAVVVNNGATFGSAGTVNGNVTVLGTLSPGASPGTMTINGGLALAGGSTTLFEMTSTVSDALVINGSLTIAPGATLRLTGNRPLTPGITYHLITASNGITGSFTTIDKASTVIGFIRQGSQSIDLLGTFVLGGGANAQVVRTVDYLNGLLISGTATRAMLDAAPSLLTADGTINQATVARLNAESYASASQIGVENGLAIAAALRSTRATSQGEEPGLFTFGQTLGGWRRLPGATVAGTSRADISTYGALAGIGIGSQTASLGAFVGYINARQRTGGLAAKTEADGLLAGIMAQASFGGFDVAGSFSYDGSSADTNRTLINGNKLSTHYRLRGWTADMSLGRSLAIGAGWSMRPEVGLTHISSHRGSAAENGDGIWALDVAAHRTKATFLNGGLALKGATAGGISPWLSVGIRHQLSGTRSSATAAFVGVPDGLTVAGVKRNATLANIGAGATVDLSTGMALFFGANSEFGADSSGESATVGLKIRF